MGLRGVDPSIEQCCRLSVWTGLHLLLIALGLDMLLVLLPSLLLLGYALVGHGGRADEFLGSLPDSLLGRLVL